MSRITTSVGATPQQIPETTASQTTATKGTEQKSPTQETPSAPSPQQQATSQEPKQKVGEFKLTGKMQQAHLSSLLDAGKTLKDGMKGADVAKLQDFLIQKGYMTQDQKATGPGVFGPRTEAALKAFQKDHGLKQDGILGQKTRQAMGADTALTAAQIAAPFIPGAAVNPPKPEVKGVSQVTMNPATTNLGAKEVPDSKLSTSRSLEEQAKLYDKYSNLIPEGKLKQGTNEMNIAGLRHHDVGSSKDLRSYDDRFVVLYKDEGGNKRVQIFEGATHTGQKSVASDKREDGTYRAKFTDVSGDGKSDIAYIQPGTYDFHLGKSKKYGDHLRPDQNISAWRDTNQDGKITGKELDQNHSAKAILFHKGGTEAPRSVGCQTMEPNEFDNFMELIKKDPNDKVSYTLVDASK